MVIFECIRCRLSFSEYKSYQDHLAESTEHHYCKPCQREFASHRDKQVHLEESQKHEDYEKRRICQWCATEHDDLHAHNGHHHTKCRQCRRWFKDDMDLVQHRTAEHPDLYCTHCKKLCHDPNGLKMHLASSKHTPKNIICPHPDCEASYVTLGCLIAHFEGGKCPSGMDLRKLENHFRSFDKENLFIKSDRICDAYNAEMQLMDESKDNQCPICPDSKVFVKPTQLDQHLNSSKH